MAERKSKRVDARYDLILKVEFGSVAQFHSDYLSNLSSGGLRLHTDHPLKVGQRLDLNLSFPGMLAAVTVEAEVRWTKPDEGEAGVAFTNLDARAKKHIERLVEAAHSPSVPSSIAILFVEQNPILREAYGREVHNWADLEGQPKFDLIHVEDVHTCIAALGRRSITLAIVDVDGVSFAPRELFDEVRRHAPKLPIVIIASDADPATYGLSIRGDAMYLQKPLAFGRLMRTLKVLTQT